MSRIITGVNATVIHSTADFRWTLGVQIQDVIWFCATDSCRRDCYHRTFKKRIWGGSGTASGDARIGDDVVTGNQARGEDEESGDGCRSTSCLPAAMSVVAESGRHSVWDKREVRDRFPRARTDEIEVV